MKRLHRDGLYTWSRIDDERDLDFNTTVWARADGCVVVDPLPLSPHDEEHLRKLGGVSLIVVTNSDHTRATVELRALFAGARVAAPGSERDAITAKLGNVTVDRWLGDGDVVVAGMRALALHGSKTPGELALVVDSAVVDSAGADGAKPGIPASAKPRRLSGGMALAEPTAPHPGSCVLITGDLVRAPRACALATLPAAKLADPAAARASLRRLAELPLEAVLVGDGWPLFADCRAHMQ